jgi:hypothetical protein
MSEDDLIIHRIIDISLLKWPEGVTFDKESPYNEEDDYNEDEDEDHDIMLGWYNREYMDFRGISWEEAQEAFDYETSILERFASTEETKDIDELIDDDEDDDFPPLAGLDVGVASAVMTLSAARCITITSCNGGANGHVQDYPVIVFRCQTAYVPLLVEIAEIAGCGLENSEAGAIALFAGDVHKIVHFAKELLQRRSSFEARW